MSRAPASSSSGAEGIAGDCPDWTVGTATVATGCGWTMVVGSGVVGRDRTSFVRARKPSAGTAAGSQPGTDGFAWASWPARDNAAAARKIVIGYPPIGRLG